jgi:hypothetical protein
MSTNKERSMNDRILGRALPLSGLVYAVTTLAGFGVIGKFPDGDTPVSELTSFYASHHGRVAAGGLILLWATVAFAVFGCALWARLRSAGVNSAIAAAALAGTAVSAAGALHGAETYWVLGHIATHDTVSSGALQALHIMGSEGGLDSGLTILLLAAGAAGILANAIPKWLAWPAVALAILQLTPIGFFASLAFLLWAAVTGVVLGARPRAAARLETAVA